MDTSEQYIKMCQKARAIQAAWKPAEGDFSYGNPMEYGGKEIVEVWAAVDADDWEWKAEKHTWLPRQDQLQEMVGGFAALEDFWYWCSYDNSGAAWDDIVQEFVLPVAADGLTSLEQLWLAYVMSEKYGKRWTGEEWA
ncbi:MAG: hypothetical protein BWY79_00278 [Actinobacteria bacterium ADurb.Bin444]|nr:MAG: hypothetical protein BWY79_00278 [Actinobacteria bacterium ADurb.Bin444]